MVFDLFRVADADLRPRLRHPAYLGLRDDVRVRKVEGRGFSPARAAGTDLSRAKSREVPALRIPADSDLASLLSQLGDTEKRRKNGRLMLPGGVGGLWEGLRESAGVDLLAAIDHLKT